MPLVQSQHPQAINSQRLLERFLRYVQIDTTAQPDTSVYPSSPGQLELGQLLVQELVAMGAENPHQDAFGLVWATIPSSVADTAGIELPAILFNAHLDTSPEASGSGVRPQVIKSYTGGDIPLLRDNRVIRVGECPALADLHGHCLITTDGTTLLGGDDKAGVACIMELAEHLIEHRHLQHGPVRILFTCDEEIGRGAQHMDLNKAQAAAGYTLDGSGHGEVEGENFSADQITVKAIGANIHPSIGKGRMINASRALASLIAHLPIGTLAPEATDGRQGFIHPYHMHGDVSLAEARILLRDFDTQRLDEQAAEHAQRIVAGVQFQIERVRQYRNMADYLKKSPHVLDFACQALEQLGRQPHLGAIRGGTDGALFSEMGLPTPNLSVGQHNIHSPLEFASLDEMIYAIEHAIELLDLWQTHARS
jgi:tripeptide aminopeptidase